MFVSKKLVFPKEDSQEYSHVKDTRDHFRILSDIVNILSEKLEPEMKPFGMKFCREILQFLVITDQV